MAYICRHTSLTPDDVNNLTPYQYRIFLEKLCDIISRQNSFESGGVR